MGISHISPLYSDYGFLCHNIIFLSICITVISRKKDEYLWAVDELERGTKFYRIIPIVWLFGHDEWLVNESVTRAKRVWERR